MVYPTKSEIEDIFLRTFNIKTNLRLDNGDEEIDEAVERILKEAS